MLKNSRKEEKKRREKLRKQMENNKNGRLSLNISVIKLNVNHIPI